MNEEDNHLPESDANLNFLVGRRNLRKFGAKGKDGKSIKGWSTSSKKGKSNDGRQKGQNPKGKDGQPLRYNICGATSNL
eukprot:12899820-Prorocentrum_lima.AAC.1